MKSHATNITLYLKAFNQNTNGKYVIATRSKEFIFYNAVVEVTWV